MLHALTTEALATLFESTVATLPTSAVVTRPMQIQIDEPFISLAALQAIFEAVKILFAFAFGACVGSLSNVLVYRIPLGLDYVSPQSRCTNCDTRLTWRENIPIFGWLFLRGKCRFCNSPVSAEYPIVETFMALLWAAVWIVCYTERGTWLGDLVMPIRPEWAMGGFVETWPIYIAIVTLFACLTCATLVDWRTFTIPQQFTTFPVIIAVIAHPLWAWYVSANIPGGTLRQTAWVPGWSIATFGEYGWPWLGAAIGGTLGLAFANLALWRKWLQRSFADYGVWEKAHIEKLDAEGKDPTNAENWTAYPHARREMLRELLFVGMPLAAGLAGFALAQKLAGPWVYNPNTFAMETNATVPLALQVLTGTLLGYLIGGGVVWLFRILGSLGFGKEALGLGDVHLMAAVGAVLGWIDPVIAFFGGAILGMIIFGLQLISGKGADKVMPFGPPLAMATVLLFFAKPAFEALASWAMKTPINLP
jgi:leader peptidase (prepilin peptidase) / N-methyltransferase